MQSDTKRRGRPRSYDPEAALKAALQVFRTHGYSATSLDLLSEATGMNRPSLYAAFGNKKAIYRQALAHYHRDLRRKLGTVLFGKRGLREDLSRFYLAALEEYDSPVHGMVGCSMICTATTEAVHDEEIRADLSQALNRIDLALRRRFRQARDEFPGLDAGNTALVASAILHSLAIRTRARQQGFDARDFISASVNNLIKVAASS